MDETFRPICDYTTSIPPKSFLVGGTIERLVTSSPNYFIRDLKQFYVQSGKKVRNRRCTDN